LIKTFYSKQAIVKSKLYVFTYHLNIFIKIIKNIIYENNKI